MLEVILLPVHTQFEFTERVLVMRMLLLAEADNKIVSHAIDLVQFGVFSRKLGNYF